MNWKIKLLNSDNENENLNYLLSPYENKGFLKRDELRIYEIFSDRNKNNLKKLYDFIN